MIDFFTVAILCTGIGHTTPTTDIELEFRDPSKKFSTIRYEFSEGAYKGTAYSQSIGRIGRTSQGPHFIFKSEDGPRQTILSFDVVSEKISRARLTHDGSYNKGDEVSCIVED